MNRIHANRVLDAARSGALISEALITAALQATGDLSAEPIEHELAGVIFTERWADAWQDAQAQDALEGRAA